MFNFFFENFGVCFFTSHYVYGLKAKILRVSVPKNNFYQLDQYMNTSYIRNTGFFVIQYTTASGEGF